MLRRFPMCALLAVGLVLAISGCGDSSKDVASDIDGSFIDFADADPAAPDAGPNVGCQPSAPACNNCEDDDGDGLIDGFDPECTGPLDDREDSFETGIPGDNIDAKVQDCFFDGNSGGGDDKCKYHTCCLLVEECPEELQPPDFDPAECVVTEECRNNCQPLTPPGCDCFGCCTICNDVGCFDVVTNPAVAPDCTADVVDDETKCPRCNQTDECGGDDCAEFECVLCPGQTEEDLPPECDVPECPGDLTPCTNNSDCLDTEFCQTGCCVRIIS